MSEELTYAGQRVVDTWLEAQKAVASARDQLNRRDTDLLNATAQLGKWLLPSDAKPGEKIAVWHGDSLIQAEVVANRDPIITVRLRGKHLHAA